MAEPPDSEYRDVLPVVEELQQLNRAGVVVYGARSGLRALMLVRFVKEINPLHLEAAFRAVQAAIAGCTAQNTPEARRHAAAAAAAAETIAVREHAEVVAAEAAAARAAAAKAAASSVPFDTIYAAEAAAAWVADATANAISAATYAAGAAGARTADVGAAFAAAAFGARAAVDVSARAACRAAARADYDRLLGQPPASLGPPFFRESLWPRNRPDWWEQARCKWHEAMNGAGLTPLGRQYEDWLKGKFEPIQMLREVEEWCVRYEQLYGPPRRKWRSGNTIPPM